MSSKQRFGIIIAMVLLIIASVCMFLMQDSLNAAGQNEAELTDRLAELEQQLAAQDSTAETLGTEKAQAEADLKAAQAEVARLETSLTETTTAKTELEKQLSEATTAKTDLEKQLNEATTAKTELEKQLNEATTAKAELEKQLSEATTAKTELEKQLNEATTAKAELEKQLNEATAVQPAPVAVVTAAPQTEPAPANEAELAALRQENEQLKAQIAEMELIMLEAQAEESVVLAYLTVRDGAAQLGLTSPAREGQTLAVRLSVGDRILGEAMLTEPGAVLESLPLDELPAVGTECLLEYEVQDAAGNVIWRVRIPMITAEE